MDTCAFTLRVFSTTGLSRSSRGVGHFLFNRSFLNRVVVVVQLPNIIPRKLRPTIRANVINCNSNM
jgi:hypothetical protein